MTLAPWILRFSVWLFSKFRPVIISFASICEAQFHLCVRIRYESKGLTAHNYSQIIIGDEKISWGSTASLYWWGLQICFEFKYILSEILVQFDCWNGHFQFSGDCGWQWLHLSRLSRNLKPPHRRFYQVAQGMIKDKLCFYTDNKNRLQLIVFPALVKFRANSTRWFIHFFFVYWFVLVFAVIFYYRLVYYGIIERLVKSRKLFFGAYRKRHV